MKEILINSESKELRCAYLVNGKLHDLIIERKKSRQISGNIYRGQVKNILENIQSAFIDINESENGFIHINDILENKKKFEEMYEMDFESIESKEANVKNPKEIGKILKIDQPVLVQVVKESIGTKGARLTSNISIAGRYLVLLPNTSHRGVSRKIEDRNLRDTLKKFIKALDMPKEMGLICRTASIEATNAMLLNEVAELIKIWQEIVEKFHTATEPQCLYEESDILKKTVIRAIDKKYDGILTDDFSTYKRCTLLYSTHSQEHPVKIELYRGKSPLFEKYNVEKEIDKALKRKVYLPSGGYLFLDKTEAMYTIDVNSGRSSGKTAKNVEESLVQINLEAAEEIARQLRIRNIGGLIICDFIDMRSRKNQKRVLEKLKTCMKEDSAKCTILGMSEFGLIEMTRQRHRESLIQIMFVNCPYCNGSSRIKSFETVSIEIERALRKLYNAQKIPVQLFIHPELNNYLDLGDKEYFHKLAKLYKSKIDFKTKDLLHLNDFEIFNSKTFQKIPI